jgi:hypothetical protein
MIKDRLYLANNLLEGFREYCAMALCTGQQRRIPNCRLIRVGIEETL